MKKGPSNGIWEGKMMPSILRGAREHNKMVLEQRQEKARLELAKSLRENKKSTSQSVSISESKTAILADVVPTESKGIFAKAREVLAKMEENSKAISKVASEASVRSSAEVATVTSSLYCHETLDTPPNSPQKKPVILSPFSSAKAKARALGVGLGEDCRGMYEDDELNRRIEKIAELNKNLQRIKKQ